MTSSSKAAALSFDRIPTAGRVGLGVALMGLLGVAYFMIPYSDISTQIMGQKQQEGTLRADLAQARESEAAYLTDLAELTEKQQRQRELNKVLPQEAQYPAFLSALQGVANVTGVALNSWEPQEEVPQQFFGKVPMKLTLSGHFHQIVKFFYGVGQLDRIINFENIAIGESSKQTDEVYEKAECLATAFHALSPSTTRNAKNEASPAPNTPQAPASAGSP